MHFLLRTTSWVPVAGLALALLPGCPGNNVSVDGPRVDASDISSDIPSATPETFVARFEITPGGDAPAPFQIPFPSDVYRGADGRVSALPADFSGLNLVRNVDILADALGALDGFGLNTGAIFVVDATSALPDTVAPGPDLTTLVADVDTSLTPGATALFVDLTPGLSATDARVPCVSGWHGHAFHAITVVPEHATLTPGHTYAVALTTGIRAQGSGRALAASPSFTAIRDNAPGARTTRLGTLYGAAVDRVVEVMGAGFTPARLASLAVFTAQTTPRQLRVAHDALARTPAPTLNTAVTAAGAFHIVRFGATHGAAQGWSATLDEWLGTPLRHNGQDLPGFPMENEPNAPPHPGLAHDAIGAVLSATFTAPDYRDARGHLVLGPDGAPVASRPANILSLTLVVPRGPAPSSAGYPVAIFGHGLGNQHREMMTLANELARMGIATAGIDHPTFGLRAALVDSTSLENGTYRGPDGFGDSASYPVTDFFANLNDMLAFRDNIRQAALDLMQLRRALANPDNDLSFIADEYSGTAPRLDGQHIGYVGHSLGGIIGTVFTGSDPDINPVVLSVTGGAFLTHLAADAPNEGALLGTATQLVFGAPAGEVLDTFHPVSNLIQMAIDGADPASFAAALTHPASGRPRDVLLTEALWDETVSNSSTALLAYIMGIPQIQPVALQYTGLASIGAPVSGNMAMGTTAAYLQNTPATHGESLDNRYGTVRRVAPFPTSDTNNRFPALAHPYLIRQWIVPYQQNIARFLRSGFGAGPTRITIDGMVPLVDHDDDGFTDDEERAAGTDAQDPASHPAGTVPHTRDVGF